MGYDTFANRQESTNDFGDILFGANLQISRAEHMARAHTITVHVHVSCDLGFGGDERLACPAWRH
jgi:hypothetical protein